MLYRVPALLCLLFLLLRSDPVRAAAWLQDTRRCYAKVGDRSILGSMSYTAVGLRETREVPFYQDHQLNLYAECGVHPWITVMVAATPLGYASSDDNGTAYVGPISAGGRLGILRDGALRLAVSARYGYSPPVGDEVLSSTLTDDGAGIAIYQPTLENHFGEILIEAGIGFSLGPTPAFVVGTLGARFQSAEGVDHVLVGSLQVGVTLMKRLVLDLHLALHEPGGGPVKYTNTAGVGQTRYLGFGITASYWFKEFLGVYFTFDGVFYAESNAATPSFGIGLETRFSL